MRESAGGEGEDDDGSDEERSEHSSSSEDEESSGEEGDGRDRGVLFPRPATDEGRRMNEAVRAGPRPPSHHELHEQEQRARWEEFVRNIYRKKPKPTEAGAGGAGAPVVEEEEEDAVLAGRDIDSSSGEDSDDEPPEEPAAPGEPQGEQDGEEGWPLFIEKGGQWYAGTWEWLAVGKKCRNKKAVAGDHIKKDPLKNWKPKSGDTLYFMVGALSRFPHIKNVSERSNIVKAIWP